MDTYVSAGYSCDMQVTTRSLTEFKQEAKRFVSAVSPRKDRATIVVLSGKLGAGKTAFVQGVAQQLGITELVTSPT